MRFTAQDMIQNAVDADPGLVEGVGFARFDAATGVITQIGTMGRSHIQQLIDAGQPYAFAQIAPGADNVALLESLFVDLATKEVRTKQPFPGTLTGLQLTGVPVPCRVGISPPGPLGRGWFAPTWVDAADSVIDLEFAFPGTYRVLIESAPFMRGEFAVVFNG